jgi:hypothetical protein
VNQEDIEFPAFRRRYHGLEFLRTLDFTASSFGKKESMGNLPSLGGAVGLHLRDLRLERELILKFR